jgi:hypothetical protein
VKIETCADAELGFNFVDRILKHIAMDACNVLVQAH